MSAMANIGILQSQNMERLYKFIEDDHEDDSYDDTPFNSLSSRSRNLYNDFLRNLKSENINYFDTYSLGLSCIMVYPTDDLELSCIFIPYVDVNTIEIKICKTKKNIEDIINSLPEDVYVYYEDIVRSSNLASIINWMKTLQ